MKKAVITGAGGFIGRNLTRRLLRENIAVYAIDVDTARIPRLEGVTALDTDIGDRAALSRVLKEADGLGPG